jgi:2-C-methyl-D-erythritol 4-phosphate cytidylyltransferase
MYDVCFVGYLKSYSQNLTKPQFGKVFCFEKLMKKYAIIVAGGSGSRMKSELPKQFIEIAGLPILMHTLLRFKEADATIEIVLVLPENQIEFWQELLVKYDSKIDHQIVKGGASRFQSGKNGLAIIDDNSLVAIHDGVRPFVSKDVILRSFEMAEMKGNAVVSVASKDSVRLLEGSHNQAIDRSTIRMIQTPQTFQTNLLKAAFTQEESPLFTDDASVFESAGYMINLIDGDYENIKITTPEDLIWGEIFFKLKK